MNIPGKGKLQRVVRRFQKKLASKALILMYHRIAEVEIDPWSLCVTSQNFAQHLEVLQKHYLPISLKELMQAHRDHNIPDRSVVITFDDGYADNLHCAKPILERYGIPATFFVSTGYLGKKGEFWWDELERLLLQPGKLPQKLILDINGSPHQWDLGTAASYSTDNYQSDRTSKVHAAKPGSRISFHNSVWQVLLPLSATERRKALDEILIWATAEPKPRSNYRSLLTEELCALAQGQLVEIGAHTVTHPFLSTQFPALQLDEIKQSKVDLEEMINCPVTSFSYPFGDRTAETVELARSSGFDCACSTVKDIVWQQSNYFDLPRFGVDNWNGEEFTTQLSRWFHN